MRFLLVGLILASFCFASGCKKDEVEDPVFTKPMIENPLMPGGKKPESVDDWKKAETNCTGLLKQAQIGLDAAQEAWWKSLFSWSAGIGTLVVILIILSFFIPQTSAFATSLSWLLRPLAEIIAGVSGLSFFLVWLVPYRHEIMLAAAAFALAYLLFRMFYSGAGKLAYQKVATGLSKTLDICKNNLYKDGDTTKNLLAVGADLELAKSLRDTPVARNDDPVVKPVQ